MKYILAQKRSLKKMINEVELLFQVWMRKMCKNWTAEVIMNEQTCDVCTNTRGLMLTKWYFLLSARFFGSCYKNPFRIFLMKDNHGNQEWKNVWLVHEYERAHKVILLTISPFLRTMRKILDCDFSYEISHEGQSWVKKRKL